MRRVGVRRRRETKLGQAYGAGTARRVHMRSVTRLSAPRTRAPASGGVEANERGRNSSRPSGCERGSPVTVQSDPATGRSPSAGACFLYVAVSAYEDLLKLGFSRDPLARWQQLHPRWFEAFDLDRSLLVATETVRDARALELSLRRQLVAHNAPALLTARRAAGGHTEWYRGAHEAVRGVVREWTAGGHVVHDPARPWLRDALRARADRLYAWTEAMLSPDELDGIAGPTRMQRGVRDALDAFTALGIDVERLLPPRVHAWYRAAT